MCCCLVHGVCRLSRCRTKSYYIFPFALYALGHDLSLLNFFIQVTDTSEYRFWCELCPVSSANTYHQRAQETVLFWHEEKHGCSPALPAVCFPCMFRVAVFSGTEMLAGFLAYRSSPCQRPQGPHLLMFPPHTSICSETMELLQSCFNYLDSTGGLPGCVWRKSSNREKEWDNKFSEWLAAAMTQRKIMKTSPWIVKWSARGWATPDVMAGVATCWFSSAVVSWLLCHIPEDETFLCSLAPLPWFTVVL